MPIHHSHQYFSSHCCLMAETLPREEIKSRYGITVLRIKHSNSQISSVL